MTMREKGRNDGDKNRFLVAVPVCGRGWETEQEEMGGTINRGKS